MTRQKAIIPIGQIEQRILLIRGQKVMLDADLAVLYGTTTKRLNEQVRRNCDRFPQDFMFQLTKSEKAEVVAICDHLPFLDRRKLECKICSETLRVGRMAAIACGHDRGLEPGARPGAGRSVGELTGC